MDLVVTNSDFNTLLADVTITHPSPSQNQSISPAMLAQGYFAAHRESTKRTKYTPAADSISSQFIPLVLETYGKMGKAFATYLKLFAHELFKNSPNSDATTELNLKGKLLNMGKARLSCVLQRANSRLLISKLSRTQQALQRHSNNGS